MSGLNRPQKPGKKPGNFYWIYGVVLLLLLSTLMIRWSAPVADTSFIKFEQMVEAGDVNKVIIVNGERGEVYLKAEALNKEAYKKDVRDVDILGNKNKGPHYVFEIGLGKETIRQKLEEWNQQYDLLYDFKTETSWTDNMGWLLPIVIMVVIWFFIMRRMTGGGGGGAQIFNIGKSKANLYDKDINVKVTFNDVAGLEEAKEEVKEIVDFLKNPKRYTTLGAKIPKGALLVGPPGTGKTLIAKAVAGEAQVPFFSLSGSDFVEMFVGVGASRVRDLFKQAKEKAPCIIFIDEIDAIGRARGRSISQGANDERENTLNQLLTEMDGFASNSGVIILAATNRADILDRALLRAGRFDRQICVDMPDVTERREIFKVHLKPIKYDKKVDIDFLARQTPGFSGADIANICNEAALIAARKKNKVVGRQDFLDAVDRIIGGLEKKSKIITPEEKERIAHHEAGHASVSWLLRYASPLVKVTIVPRGQSLGAAWYLPEERQLTTKEQMLDEVCALLGGRASEQVFFDEVSTGALNDLERTTKQVYAMVSMYGLDSKIGNLSYYDSTGQQEYNLHKPYSEDTAQKIDDSVSRIVEGEYERALQTIRENKDKVGQLAERLLKKEVLFKEDVKEIFGKRPWENDDQVDDADGKPKDEPARDGVEKEPVVPEAEKLKKDGALKKSGKENEPISPAKGDED